RRSDLLGLDDAPSSQMFLMSIKQANETLGRLNSALERRSQTATHQGQLLEAVAQFHANATPGRSVHDVIDQVVASAAKVLGAEFYAVLYQPAATGTAHEIDRSWLICQYNREGTALGRQYMVAPPHSPNLAQIEPNQPLNMLNMLNIDLMSILPWISKYLPTAQDERNMRLLPLTCGWGTAAVLLHDRRVVPRFNELQPLIATWAAAIASTGQHDATQHLGEELAGANRALAETHNQLLQHESMARLGQMAAGAAHEMNDPLAVISGRSQLLAQSLQPGSNQHHAAEIILDQVNRLSSLITSLHLFAEPPKPVRRQTDVAVMLDDLIKAVQSEADHIDRDTAVTLHFKSVMTSVPIDTDHICAAVRELLLNALQAPKKTTVQVIGCIDQNDYTLVIEVIDDGQGMDSHVLAHAIDPFFSAKPAGRRVGMGLTRARRLVESHNGRLLLHSTPGQGTRALLTKPLVREPDLTEAPT
ncbi:MAG: HAMP domain-containing sensor histidine kinase, partial [Pirellulaceae bacterium]|nr:HAMP domain-containing sensor histidine kinase [Pirellulaceae bacterium]